MDGKYERKSSQSSSKDTEKNQTILNETSGFYIREAYKTMRTNVSFSMADSEGSRVLMITSAMQSEGKSCTALNFAITTAEDGNRVIILDCDLRKPKIGRLTDIATANGLSDVLIHPEILPEVITNYRTGLDVLLSGHIPPNPSELLGSVRMSKLIEKLRQRYDYIILDTPPVNVVTDAVVMSKLVDGVLMVIRARQTDRGAATHAVEQLDYAKAPLLGFILNGVKDEATSYSKYRYKRYGYTKYGYGKYGYSHYGYDQYGSNPGYGYGGYGYGYGYGSRGDRRNVQEDFDAVTRAAEEARNG